MMKRFYVLIVAMLTFVTASAQTGMTTTESKTLYRATSKKRVSIHDPSVVFNPTSNRYYIFGSHKAGAYTTDMMNWTQANPKWKVGSNNNALNKNAFVTPAVKKVKKGGVEVDFPQFNAMDWAGRTDASYNIDGNMWAPDVIWNPTMNKWCMYLSINGDNPNNIDPCVFYDEEGKLWIAYGSWSGGIFMLELDEETGLRDYDVTYTTSGGDPYFGKRIAGGYYVSGEGPYIEHIGDYYYLFMSYGFYSPDGGYEMRIFRSTNPDGPYKDAGNHDAIFTSYVMNYGTGDSDTRGMKLMGAYNHWGVQTVGECAQGHNSIIAANGETITDEQIATTQPFTKEELAGTYNLLIHKYKMDYQNMEEVTPISITLSADGKIRGDKNGSWSIEEGTGYIRLSLGGIIYNGVVFEETMDGNGANVISITAISKSGVSVWAYNPTLPSTGIKVIRKGIYIRNGKKILIR